MKPDSKSTCSTEWHFAKAHAGDETGDKERLQLVTEGDVLLVDLVAWSGQAFVASRRGEDGDRERYSFASCRGQL
jgi:hypothetical protein